MGAMTVRELISRLVDLDVDKEVSIEVGGETFLVADVDETATNVVIKDEVAEEEDDNKS